MKLNLPKFLSPLPWICIPLLLLFSIRANSQCTGIVNLSCGAAVSATPSGAGVWSISTCGFSTPGQEKIFTFTPTITGAHSLQVNSVSGGYIDYFYKAASGGCTSTGWTCIDDINFTGTTPIGTLTAGVQYYILLDPEGTGAYNHNFQIVCPASDPCSSIVSLTCASPVTASLTGSGSWSNLTCGFSTPGQEKVYSFTPTATGAHSIQVTSSSGSYIDYMYKAASGGCSSTGWTCIDDISITGTYPIATLTAGVQYYILLDAESTAAVSQTFQVVCPAPAADPCTGIAALACATPVSVSLSGAGTWNNLTCGFTTAGQEKVYSFTPTVTGAHSIQVTSSSGSYIDYMYKAASGGCSSTGWTCIDDISITGTYPIATLTAGVQYYILLDAESTAAVSHTFQVVCPSAVDPCAGITTLACAAPVSVSLAGSGVWNNSNCGFSTPGQEKVYSFTPTITGAHSIQVTSATGTGYMDYAYKAASGGCSATGWTCIDDINFTGTFSIGTLTAGVQYYILLDAESSTSSTQTFQVVCPSPPDPCASITSLTCATPASVSLTGTGVWNNSNCGFSTPGQEKVYSFTPTITGAHSIQVTSASGTGYMDYAYKAASGGCSATGWTCIDDINFTGTFLIGTLTAGVQYYILLDGETTTSSSQTFQVVCPAPDPCASATTLVCATPASVSLTGTGVWNNSNCGFSTPGQEKVYSFTPTATGTHSIQVTSASGTGYIDYAYKAASGGCSATGWTCIDDINFTGTFPIGTLTAGVQYYILLDGETTASSSQTFQVVCPIPVPACLAGPTSPANGASFCLPGPGSLSWSTASGATSYDVYFGTSPTPPFYTNTAGTSISVGSLGAGTYYWQIRPVNAGGAATGCPVWSFTVQADPIGNLFSNPIIIGSLPYSVVGTTFAFNCWTDDYSGATNQPSPDAFYRFTNSACQSLVSISLCGSAFDTYLHLLNSSGTEIAVNDDNGPLCSGSQSSIRMILPAGTYYIVVEGYTVNFGTYSLNVSATDGTPPTISNCPNNQNVLRNGSCVATLPDYRVVPTTSDNCPGSITLSQTPPPGTMLAGTTLITLTATDVAGNTATCTFTATPVDQTAPGISNCPGNQTVGVDANCQGNVPDYRGAITTSDNCPGTITVGQSPSPGSIFTGNTLLTLTATDAAGNTSTCTFFVTAADNTAPTITCPAGATVAANSACQHSLGAYGPLASFSDNCTNPSVSQNPVAGTLLGLGTHIIVLTATDVAFNTATCTLTVVVQDQTAPNIMCPASYTINNDNNVCGATVNYAVTSSDNCAGTSSALVRLAGPSSGSVFPVGTTTVTYRATDLANNSSTCSFSVTVNDAQLPTLVCPSAQVKSNDPNLCSAVATYTMPSANDNCTGASVSLQSGPSSGSAFPVGVTTLVLRATDASNNTRTCTFTITVNDTQAPTLSCPAGQTKSNDPNLCSAVATYTMPSANDNCTGASVSLQSGPSSGSAFPVGVTTVVLRATDASNNTGTCSFTITVNDTQAPTLSCPANQIKSNDPNLCSAVATYTMPSANDNCTGAGVSLQSGLSSGSAFPLGISTVVLRATDVSNNTATCSFTITVNDTQLPTVTCPANQVKSTDPNLCSAVATYTMPTANDNCTGAGVSLQSGLPSGSAFPKGVNIVVLRATDASNNSSTCSFTITVNDTQLPTLTCPASQVKSNDPNLCSAVATYAMPSASDNCTGASVALQSGPASGSAFPVGVTTVVLRATDASNNSSTCSFTVTVNDTQAPTFTCPANQTKSNDPNLCSAVATYLMPIATDNCTGASVVLQSGLASGSAFPVGANTIVLRATDASGNTGTCSFSIIVRDVQPPASNCPANAVRSTNPNVCTYTAVGAEFDGSSTDNCQVLGRSYVLTGATTGSGNTTLAGKVFQKGVTIVSWTAIDASQNTSSCSFTVTVNDNQLPVALCKPAFTLLLNLSGTGTVTPANINNGSSDNCSALTMTVMPNTFTCANIGNNVVTLKVSDQSNNMATCTSVVTVKDQTAPTALCKDITVFLDETGHVSITADHVNNGSFDACGIATMSINNSNFSCLDIPGSPAIVQLTLKDIYNNMSSCLSNVTVKDATPPVAVCQDKTIQLNSQGKATVYGSMLAADSYDNCSVWSYSPVQKLYTCANVGSNNLTITVRDYSNNAATCVSVITVLPPPGGCGGLPLVGGNDEGGGATVETDVLNLALAVYPNPSEGEVTVAFHLPEDQTFTLRIFDLTGRKVTAFQQEGRAGENALSLVLSHLPPGLYILDLQSGRSGEQQRLVIER